MNPFSTINTWLDWSKPFSSKKNLAFSTIFFSFSFFFEIHWNEQSHCFHRWYIDDFVASSVPSSVPYIMFRKKKSSYSSLLPIYLIGKKVREDKRHFFVIANINLLSHVFFSFCFPNTFFIKNVSLFFAIDRKKTKTKK